MNDSEQTRQIAQLLQTAKNQARVQDETLRAIRAIGEEFVGLRGDLAMYLSELEKEKKRLNGLSPS